MPGRTEKLNQLERLLRTQGPAPLGAGFKQRVMADIAHLPDPELTAVPHGLPGLARGLRLLSPGELVAIGLTVLGLALTLLPGVGSLLESWQWELASLDLSIAIGDLALSGSLLSMLAVAIGAAFMAGVGAYASRNHLLGA